MPGYESRLAAVLLSRGSQWSPMPTMAPYLAADPLNPWPTSGATARAVFYGNDSAVLATVTGTVTADAITFTAPASVVDAIPAGAKFEVIVDITGDGSFTVRYGEVMRREAVFAPRAVSGGVDPALYSDSFPTLGLSSSWLPLAGTTYVYDNSAASLPNGIGPGNVFNLNTSSASMSALRWFAPLHTDTVAVSFNLLNRHAYPTFSTARTRIIVCADYRMTSYLGVQFEENTHTVRPISGTSPTTVTYPGSQVSNTVSNSPENYTLTYNQTSAVLSLYKGTTLILSYFPPAVPHGMGYRYTGLAWQNGALTDGVQVTSWTAKDDNA
jgi:hypothetical protein